MSLNSDVIVVGGGVVGLAVADAVAREGADVVLVERGTPGRGATWAAGGMLAPLGEAPGRGAFLDLGLESLRLWASWAEDLTHRTYLDPGYEQCGKLLIAEPHAADELRRRLEWQQGDGHAAAWQAGDDLRSLEPALGPEWSAGVHLPDQALVDPRRLAPALEEAARRSGVHFRLGSAVEALRRERAGSGSGGGAPYGPNGPVGAEALDGGRVTGVVLANGEVLAAEAVVLAAGAWSGSIEGLPRPLPMRPIKGQMLSLHLDRPLLRGIVAGPGAYLIPRLGPDGPLLVIGATMEDTGFDTSTDAHTIGELRRAAEALVPDLMDCTEHERWAGLRPALPDGLPVLGPDPEVDGLIYATGHHRNGILLSAATARIVADQLAGRGTDPRWDAFSAARFA